MWTGTAFAIAILIGLFTASSLLNFIYSFASQNPNVTIIIANVFFMLVGIFALGWYITSSWYKQKIKGAG